ncbi:MAG: CRISPR-associated protein Cas1, partial [Thermodesulfobacteriota bacterium]
MLSWVWQSISCHIGFFHKPRYGRSSLAADLVEEFRSPVVD